MASELGINKKRRTGVVSFRPRLPSKEELHHG
jgi:hypothetical protein